MSHDALLYLAFGLQFSAMLAVTAVAYITAWYGFIQRRRLIIYSVMGFAYSWRFHPSVREQTAFVLALWVRGRNLPALRDVHMIESFGGTRF